MDIQFWPVVRAIGLMGCLGPGPRGQAYKMQVGNHSIFAGYVRQLFMLSVLFVVDSSGAPLRRSRRFLGNLSGFGRTLTPQP